ncbi:zinc ribbon domain-containing protein [Herpetosiphon geysericola]|uniref:Zinc ribbon domain-containing protein n=1 Tax=Herpetosiphon geysericola TaxID=70996 RepID=A0A0P6Y8T1_9CHLR|nr:zinc ribbon domain-containing protein [Herpetosiphon geysericola]KPL85473.1 hypothetical protein SE18_17765 [Herpetosiphon geysericola]
MQCPHCTKVIAVSTNTCPYCGSKLSQGLNQLQIIGLVMVGVASLILVAIFLPLIQIDQTGQAFKLIDGFMRDQLTPWPERWRFMSYTLVVIGCIAFISAVGSTLKLRQNWATSATSIAGTTLLFIRVMFRAEIKGSSYGEGFWLLVIGAVGLLLSGALFRYLTRSQPNVS